VWLNSVSGSTINATFISYVTPGSTASSSAPDDGAKHAVLIQ
jgi:hypothetical protein